MDAGEPGAKRIVRLSGRATLDLDEIYLRSAINWGLPQAERYVEMLRDAMQVAAEKPDSGRVVEDRAGVRMVSVRWPKAKFSHYICFRRTKNGIAVVRILHSSMDIASHLKEEGGFELN